MLTLQTLTRLLPLFLSFSFPALCSPDGPTFKPGLNTGLKPGLNTGLIPAPNPGTTLPKFALPLKLPPNFANLYPDAVVNVSDPATTLGRTIAIPLPTHDFLKSKPSYIDAAADFMRTSLPSILAQFGVPAEQIDAKAAAATPVLLDFLKELHDSTTPALTPRGFEYRRSLWSKLGGILGDIGCGVAGVVVGPASFLFFSAEFSLLNPGGGTGLTEHQQFFVYPVHGDIANSAPVQIYYQATRPLGFNTRETVGTTFNKKFYTYLANAPYRSDPRFVWMMQNVLLHEFQHVIQYRSYGYSLIRYGDKYGFEICKDGYNNAFLENEARSKEHAADQLLVDPSGKRFFDAWAGHGLRGPLGFPTKPTYDVVDGGFWELPFQTGVLQLSNGGNTYRTFTKDEIASRGFINCKSNQKCRRPWRVVRAMCTNCGDEPDGPGGCDQEELDVQNKECEDRKASWRRLNGRAFAPI